MQVQKPRTRIYDDPNEDEFIAIYQNDDVDYSAVFFDGSNNRFYNSTDNAGSNQVWTELVSASGASDRDDENTAFAFTAYNSAPSSPNPLTQYKLDGSTEIVKCYRYIYN